MKYVFRLTAAVKMKLDAAAPPKAHRRSAFIREAILAFLCKPKQQLADRPHLRGRTTAYESVCAILNQEQIDAIKAVYPDVSVSVVIQAAVSSELKKARYTMTNSPLPSHTDATENTDADTDFNSKPRELKKSRGRS